MTSPYNGHFVGYKAGLVQSYLYLTLRLEISQPPLFYNMLRIAMRGDHGVMDYRLKRRQRLFNELWLFPKCVIEYDESQNLERQILPQSKKQLLRSSNREASTCRGRKVDKPPTSHFPCSAVAAATGARRAKWSGILDIGAVRRFSTFTPRSWIFQKRILIDLRNASSGRSK